MNRRQWLSCAGLVLPFVTQRNEALAGFCFAPGWRWALLPQGEHRIPSNGAVVISVVQDTGARAGGGLSALAVPTMRLLRGSESIDIETRSFGNALMLLKPRAPFTGTARVEGVQPIAASPGAPAQNMTVRFDSAAATPPSAPAIARIQSGQRSDLFGAAAFGRNSEPTTIITASAQLSAPVPADAKYFALHYERAPTRGFACVQCVPGSREIELFRTPGRCQSHFPGMQAPPPGGRFFGVFITEAGVVSAPSSVIVVSSW